MKAKPIPASEASCDESIPKKMQNGYDSMTVMTVCEITTTETQTKPKTLHTVINHTVITLMTV